MSTTINIQAGATLVPRGCCPSIKLVAMDFDLTLYDHANPSATLALQDCFERLSSIGVRLGLASGRSVAELEEPLREIGFAWGDPFPSFVICHEGEIRMPDGTELPAGHSWNAERARDVDAANSIVKSHFLDLDSWARTERHQIVRPIQVGVYGTNIVFETPEVAVRAQNILRTKLAENPEIEVNRNHHIVGALPSRASKGAALSQLASIERCRQDEVLAIGDNGNDISMLCDRYAFTPAVVANAIPSLRRRVGRLGGYVAQRSMAQGVCEILHHHFPKLQATTPRYV